MWIGQARMNMYLHAITDIPTCRHGNNQEIWFQMVLDEPSTYSNHHLRPGVLVCEDWLFLGLSSGRGTAPRSLGFLLALCNAVLSCADPAGNVWRCLRGCSQQPVPGPGVLPYQVLSCPSCLAPPYWSTSQQCVSSWAWPSSRRLQAVIPGQDISLCLSYVIIDNHIPSLPCSTKTKDSNCLLEK